MMQRRLSNSDGTSEEGSNLTLKLEFPANLPPVQPFDANQFDISALLRNTSQPVDSLTANGLLSPLDDMSSRRTSRLSQQLARGDVIVSNRADQYRAETIWAGKKVRGPKRLTMDEADQDKLTLEAARSSGSMDQVLAEWQVNCQVLPKGVYFHREKKAFVATICITPSRYATSYHTSSGRSSKKYDGPARRSVEEALADREKLVAATDEDDLLRVLKDIRGPNARTEKKSGHPAENVPQGVYYKPDTGTYQAQVSVNRKNVRGPPRMTLQEAISDRQRLLIAKANNQAEQECLELKMDYQRRMTHDPNDTLDGIKKRGRPRGSMGGFPRRVDRPFDFAFPGLSGADSQAAAAAALNSFPFLLASTAAAAGFPTDGQMGTPSLPMSILFPQGLMPNHSLNNPFMGMSGFGNIPGIGSAGSSLLSGNPFNNNSLNSLGGSGLGGLAGLSGLTGLGSMNPYSQFLSDEPPQPKRSRVDDLVAERKD